MSKVLRSTKDRIRHALGFELVGILMLAPLASLVFGYELAQMGVLAAAGATLATVWNYAYNLMFDHAMLKWRGSVIKTWRIRVLHALAFEAGLLVLFLPIVAWYMQIGLIEALILDISVALFYVVYAFIYNLSYDRLFPLPVAQEHAIPIQESIQASASELT